MTPEEESKVLSEHPEWVDPTTGKLFKQVHWTAIQGMNFEQLASKVGKKDTYSVYRSTSQFTHASSVTENMYRSKNTLDAIGDVKQVQNMTLLTSIFAMETLREYCQFFGVPFDTPDYRRLMMEINTVAISQVGT